MATVGYARVSSVGQSLDVQLEKLKGCDRIFKEKRSGVDTGRSALKQCLQFLRDGETLLVTKIDRLARSTSDLYRIISELAENGVSFKVVDDPSIDTTSRTGKLVMGILALIAEFENDIRRERQMDGIAKAKDRGVKFDRKRELTDDRVKEIRKLRETGETVPRHHQADRIQQGERLSGTEELLEMHIARLHSPVRQDGRSYTDLYSVEYDGEIIIVASRGPEHDLARAWLARGLTGKVTTLDANMAVEQSNAAFQRLEVSGLLWASQQPFTQPFLI